MVANGEQGLQAHRFSDLGAFRDSGTCCRLRVDVLCHYLGSERS
jgi:hypothetical protein